MSFLMTGCISFNLNPNIGSKEKSGKGVEECKIMFANPDNVYRTSTNIVIKAKTQNKKGEWVDCKYPVMIPSNWYFVSGAGLED